MSSEHDLRKLRTAVEERCRAENDVMRATLQRIVDGYGPDHLSKFCRDMAKFALQVEQ